MYQRSMNIDSTAGALLRQAMEAGRAGDRHAAAAAIVDIDAASWEAASGQQVASVDSKAAAAFKAALSAAQAEDTYGVAYALIDVDPVSGQGITARLTGVGLDPDELLAGESLGFWTQESQHEALSA